MANGRSYWEAIVLRGIEPNENTVENAPSTQHGHEAAEVDTTEPTLVKHKGYLRTAERGLEVLLHHADGKRDGPADAIPAAVIAVYSAYGISAGSMVAEQLACSPPTKANHVQYLAGSPDIRKWESCRTMPLVSGFYRGSPVSPAPAPYSPKTPSSALKTLLLRAAQISSLTLLLAAGEKDQVVCLLNHVSLEEDGYKSLEGNQLLRSPPTKTNRVQIPSRATPGFSHLGFVPDDAAGSAGFLGDLSFPLLFYSSAAPFSPESPSSAVKTSLLRSAQISSLDKSCAVVEVYRPMDTIVVLVPVLPVRSAFAPLYLRVPRNFQFFLEQARGISDPGQGSATQMMEISDSGVRIAVPMTFNLDL
ncbi:hypothetical protein PR048_025374 [Dryococelus australis]|uniref:Uncharacterized protein n=1 Tax=Dryococelus australis TaxID=614101 RepID=A0ABQ9GR93_9NEOP|nr:hypothetical protein PR048_025374 [Dryococelus australis]